MLLTQLLGWVALGIGWAATLLVTRTRHAWLIGIASAAVWATVDTRLHLWSGITGSIVAVALNVRCWRRNVTGQRGKDSR